MDRTTLLLEPVPIPKSARAVSARSRRRDRAVAVVAASVLAGSLLSLIGVSRARAGSVSARYPLSPQAVCGTSMLNGPAGQPAGSVRVDPGQDLGAVTGSAPAGTVFWLSPGTYTSASLFNMVIPKDNDSFIGAPGAVLDGLGVTRYAFSGDAVGVSIKYLTVQHFGTVPSGGSGGNINQAVVNTSASAGWTIQFSSVINNHGAGVFLGPGNTVSYDCLNANGQYGFSMYRPQVPGGSSITNITLDHNEVGYNNSDNWEAQKPHCGCTGGGKFWDTKGASVTNNWVHDNKGVGLWADTNDINFTIDGNYINDNDDEAIVYEISYNFAITNNTIKHNAIVLGRAFNAAGNGFPVSAIYISESGGDTRVDPNNAASTISGNFLEDNWGGVMLWESGDRFCGSPNNTSTSYCTRVNPKGTLTTCSTPSTVASVPYFSDCRWKTQNITVSDNDFRIDKAAVGCLQTGCGVTSLRSSNAGSPPWSPYLGMVVPSAVTYHQNNHFANNRYVGDWTFETFNGIVASWASWTAAPSSQDAGSTLSASPVTFNSPTDLPGIQFWYRADTIAQSDGSPVATWADGSGNTRTLTASGTQPTLKTAGLNGKPAVRFNGNNGLSSAAVATLAQPSTVCVVGSAANISGGQNDFVDTGVSAYNQIIGVANGHWNSYAGTLAPAGTADTKAHVFCAVFDGTTSTLRVDGGTGTTGPAGTYGITGLTVGRAAQGNETLTGDIAEVVVYHSTLPAASLDQLGGYLAGRYRLTWHPIRRAGVPKQPKA